MVGYAKTFWSPIVLVAQTTFDNIFWKSVWSGILWFAFQVFGERPDSYLWLVALILLDHLSAMAVVIARGEDLSLTRFRATMLKFLFYTVIVTVFHKLDSISPLLEVIRLDEIAISYFAVTEVLSILGTMSKATGIALPTWLMNRLQKIKDDGEDLTQKK